MLLILKNVNSVFVTCTASSCCAVVGITKLSKQSQKSERKLEAQVATYLPCNGGTSLYYLAPLEC